MQLLVTLLDICAAVGKMLDKYPCLRDYLLKIVLTKNTQCTIHLVHIKHDKYYTLKNSCCLWKVLNFG
ncbi:hypothetical protein A1QY_11270 [Vibrio anguillarum]|nr:hypothetical protein A1QY_11270 [Vibrio anguillarum]